MNNQLKILAIFLFFVFSACCRKIFFKTNESCNLENIKLNIGSNLDEVTKIIDCPIGNIANCNNLFDDKSIILLVIFIDQEGRLDAYFNKELNLVYYKYHND